MAWIRNTFDRREWLYTSLRAGGALVATSLLPDVLMSRKAPAFLRAQAGAPRLSSGVASGDVVADRDVVWSRADRPARMMVRWATTEAMSDATAIRGPATLQATDYTAKVNLRDLPAGQDIFYTVEFQSLDEVSSVSEPVRGHFRTAPASKRDIRFLWSGDTAGQGWGINPDWGGMRIYRAMAALDPDFFIHSGDTVYADSPIPETVELADGKLWRNLTTEAKSKVAETLDEFRGNFAYNLMDENVRLFNAAVPLIVQWDDHETTNNWYPTETLVDDDRYSVKSVALLSARANRAFMEYHPIGEHADERERVYRHIPYGPTLDVFVIDMRSYRGPNGANRQSESGEATRLLGREQIRWLKQSLLASRATWKVIASDMPLGLVVPDGRDAYENGANGDGPALGRELEIADLLRFMKNSDVRNVVWLTADVHYTAAHFYDPSQARFSDFAPFYEFVSGPLHAGTFGPSLLDNTFGPRVLYQKAPEPGQGNLPPSAGLQFFGQVEIDGDSEVMMVTLRDLEGAELFAQTIEPS